MLRGGVRTTPHPPPKKHRCCLNPTHTPPAASPELLRLPQAEHPTVVVSPHSRHPQSRRAVLCVWSVVLPPSLQHPRDHQGNVASPASWGAADTRGYAKRSPGPPRGHSGSNFWGGTYNPPTPRIPAPASPKPAAGQNQPIPCVPMVGTSPTPPTSSTDPTSYLSPRL